MKRLRFEVRFEQVSQGRTEDECWPWTGGITNQGYSGSVGSKPAYRRVWELFNGPLPKGLEIDHACHTDSDCKLGIECPHRRCVNPHHMRLTTRKQNMQWTTGHRGGAQCGHGPEAMYIRSSGKRRCRICHNQHNRKYKANKKRPVPDSPKGIRDGPLSAPTLTLNQPLPADSPTGVASL
jgi:HNH endonuclease